MVYKKVSAEFSGFREFLTKQNVVGLAVGLIIGGAASDLVKSLVTNIINPLIGLLSPTGKLLSDFMIGNFKIGAFLNSLINFAILLAIVYFVINKAVTMLMGETKKEEKTESRKNSK